MRITNAAFILVFSLIFSIYAICLADVIIIFGIITKPTKIKAFVPAGVVVIVLDSIKTELMISGSNGFKFLIASFHLLLVSSSL